MAYDVIGTKGWVLVTGGENIAINLQHLAYARIQPVASSATKLIMCYFNMPGYAPAELGRFPKDNDAKDALKKFYDAAIAAIA